MENRPDRRKKLFEKAKWTVTTALKIRRGIKIFLAFGSGISMAIASSQIMYDLTEHVPLSLYYAVLAGAATTAFALLFMEIIRTLIGWGKKIGLKILDRIKARMKRTGDS